MAKEYIERSKVVEVIKDYGKNAIEDGQKTLDPVDDILLLVGAVNRIHSADVVELPHEIKTNYDRIRNMSVEELGDFLLDIHCTAWLCAANDDTDYVFKYDKEWLESEVTE